MFQLHLLQDRRPASPHVAIGAQLSAWDIRGPPGPAEVLEIEHTEGWMEESEPWGLGPAGGLGAGRRLGTQLPFTELPALLLEPAWWAPGGPATPGRRQRSPGAQGCRALSPQGVHKKFSVNVVTSREQGTTRWPKERSPRWTFMVPPSPLKARRRWLPWRKRLHNRE